MAAKYKIIIDTNLWISFLIGKRLSTLKLLLSNSEFTVFICNELLVEIQNISVKQKIRKYINSDDVNDLFDIIDKCCQYIVIRQRAVSSALRDIDDLYLLSLADTVNADYILTGDKDLLTLKTHNQTKILTYNDFAGIIGLQQ